MKRTKNKPTKRHEQRDRSRPSTQKKLPFIAHIQELRKRLFIVAFAIAIGAGAAYGVQMQITNWLLGPAGNQQFIYTSPGGGIDFLFKLCLYTGVVFAIPVAVFQLLRYLEPLIKKSATRFIVWGSISSGILALLGIAFGYYIGLPAAMHFLLNQFTTQQIEALLSIQSYFSFVMMYLLGSALLFQVPLIMLLINKAKPLKPRKLMAFQRWFVVFAFIVGAIINPSPNIQDQLMLSVPMILMYQFGIVLIWIINRPGSRARKVAELKQKDAEARAARLNNFQHAQETWLKAVATTIKTDEPTVRKPIVAAPTTRAAYPLPARSVHPAPLPRASTVVKPTVRRPDPLPAEAPKIVEAAKPVAPPKPKAIPIPITIATIEQAAEPQPSMRTPAYKSIAVSFQE